MAAMDATAVKSFLIALIIVLCILLFAPFKIADPEIQSTNLRIASCELFKIRELLNKSFSSSNLYPTVTDISQFVALHKEDILCGRQLQVNKEQVIDPWGDPYCYINDSNRSVLLFSSNLLIPDPDGGEGSYMLFELHDGLARIIEYRSDETISCSNPPKRISLIEAE